jgi:hypothetical protein
MSLSQKFRTLSSSTAYPVTESLARWNGKYTAEAVERVQEVMRKDLLTDHRDHGEGRLRPSMLGLECERPALLSYEGEPNDGFSVASQMIMSAGTWRHYCWQMMGLSAGFLTDIEVPVEVERWKLRGALDGLMSNGEVFELKSVNGQRFSKIRDDGNPLHYRPLDGHVEQVHPYMLAVGTRWSSIVYEERNYLGFIEVRVQFDDGILQRMEQRFTAWGGFIAAGTLPPIREDCLVHTGTVFERCNWKESCFRVG